MRANIGEAGTEQFTVTTRFDGKLVATQPIHDPFIRTSVTTRLSRWEHFKQVFRPKTMRTQVSIDGSEGVSRAIMTLDPVELQKETEAILEDRRKSRESLGIVGYYATPV